MKYGTLKIWDGWRQLSAWWYADRATSALLLQIL
jgi:hypothetical protein